MKPFVKAPSKTMGGSTESFKYDWAFHRKTWAEAKRNSRKKRRRSDKLDLKNEHTTIQRQRL